MRTFGMIGSIAAAAALTMMAAPADAGGRYHHRGYRGDRIDGGDVLLGALLVGGVIAIASAANNRQRTVPYSSLPPEPSYPAPRYDDRYSDDLPPLEKDDYSVSDDNYPIADRSSEDAAADSCAAAAEDQARRYGGTARVQDINDVDPGSDGGWYVQGTIDVNDGTPHRFRCSLLAGDGPRVMIDGYEYAQR